MSLDSYKYNNAKAAQRTRRLLVLGASGSIGQSSLAFLERHKETAAVEVVGISVHSSLDFVRKYLSSQNPRPSCVSITNPQYKADVQSLQSEFSNVHFYLGESALLDMMEEAHQRGADTVLVAIVGAAGIQATLKAIELGMKVALANKESLVTAGPAIQKALELSFQKPLGEQALLLPVDSEHNSVFRLLYGLKSETVQKIILSASGGPFRDLEPEKLAEVRKEEVLQHPNWSMGAKITVDSAGMVNKGLELIEAHYLFSYAYDSLDAWIHRDSLVHALLKLSDSSYLFHASHTDMAFPIAHVLFFPEPVPTEPVPATSPLEWKPLAFQEVSTERYPGFYLCLEAGKIGGTAPTVLNAANEFAVAAFLRDQIHFTQIVRLIRLVLDKARIEKTVELEAFLEADRQARSIAKSCLASLA